MGRRKREVRKYYVKSRKRFIEASSSGDGYTIRSVKLTNYQGSHNYKYSNNYHCSSDAGTSCSTMEESNDRTSNISGGINNKMTSDSGYGSNSNKSNSQSQRSSGSSKSHQSSLSSGSCSFLSHPTAVAPSTDQHEQPPQGNQGSCGTPGKPEKRRKKKTKVKSSSSTDRMDLGQRLGAVEESKKNPPIFEKTNASVADNTPEPSPDSRFVPPADSKTLQMAALNHVLSCFKNVREQDLDMSDESDNENMSSSSVWSEQFEAMKDELKITPENCFGGVFGMSDGLVVHMTEEITSILGYPKDMWMGRSFMDLVHPKDKVCFASQFTSAGGFKLQGAKDPPKSSESFFCRLRQYRGLKTGGFGVTDKPVTFFPFTLTLKFREVECIDKQKAKVSQLPEGVAEMTEKKTSLYIFIGAHRISSAYQYPEEAPINPDKFVTRHSASCQLGHIDPSSVPYLGHLPQDVIGQSMLDYYHPDDMLLLRDIYEGVMVERGKPFKSKPYRFRAYNGTFATLETDWSCFINPWSWKLEFVIGQHKVVKGPLNPNVFMPPKPPDPTRPEVNTDANVKRIQEQIKQRLTETVVRRAAEPLKQRMSRRKKDLTNLLETLLNQIGNNDSSDCQTSDSVGSAFSVMERDSVMLGEISPHHDDHSGSNQSSETPPSYNQLNYRENIERFFMSHPKTTRESDESGDAEKADDFPLGSTEDEDSKGSPNYSSGSGGHRQSGNDSAGGNNENPQARNNGKDDDPCSLTEDILYRHNENMEKSLIKRHRETRGRNTSLASSHKNSRVRLYEPISGRNRTRDYPNRSLFKGNKHNNLKRTGNLAGWVSSDSSRKAQKYQHFEAPSLNYSEAFVPEPKLVNPALWPPYSVGSSDVAVTTTTVTTFTPPVESRAGGIVIPALGTIPSTTTVSADIQMQNILNQQQSRPFMCFPSQPQQFVQTPGVSYAMPGSANILYQPMGAPNIYGQPPSLYGPTPPFLMPPVAPPLLGPLYNPTGQLMPTVPGAIRTLNVNGPMQLRPNMRIIQPGAFSQMQPNSVPMSRGNPLNCARHPLSASNHSSINSGSLYPLSTQSTSSGVSALSNKNEASMAPGTSAYVLKKMPENINIRKQPDPHNKHDSSSSSSPELSNLKSGLPNRLLPIKASADFSSSDGFLDSSSSSMYSLLKSGRSDDSGSPSGSGEGKDSFNLPDRFQSHGSDDQDMLWESHLDKNDTLDYEESRRRAKLKQPPWLQDVNMTRELTMGYQIADGDMSEILQRDLKRLQIIGNQSTLVDEQLEALYNELQADGKANNLNLEEGETRYHSGLSSGNEDEDSEEVLVGNDIILGEKIPNKREISRADYEKIVQVYEENAPFPRRNRCTPSETGKFN